MNERKKGIFISYLQTIVSIVASLLYVPILLRILGKNEYGLYQMVGSFFSFVTLFKSSISNGVLKYYCKAIQRGNKKELENTLANARTIYRVLSIIIIIISFVIILAFRIIYSNSLQGFQIEEATWMLGLLFIDLLVSTSNAIYVASVIAYEKFTFDRLITLITQILQPIVCLCVVFFNPYAIYMVIVQLLMDIAIALIKYNYCIQNLGVSIQLYSYDKEVLKGIYSLSSYILFSNIADQIFWKTDQLVLGKYLNTAVVAVYSIAMQINICYMNIGIAISSVFFPKLSGLNEKKDGLKQMSELFTQIGKYAYILLLLILSGFIIFGKEFINLWVGEEYLEAYVVALIVIIPFTIDIIQHLGISILQVMGKYAFRAKMYFAAAVINLIFTIILVQGLGAIGAAISTGISLFIVNGLIMNLYYYKIIGLDIFGFWKNICTVTVKYLMPILIIFFFDARISIQSNWIILSIKILVYSIVYSIWTYIFVFDKKEKQNVLGIIIGKSH